MKSKIISSLIFIVLPICFANASTQYMPRVYLSGAAGSNVLGKADVLAPVYTTATNNLFVYAQGKYAYEEQTWEDNTWTGSFGLGYRQILNNTFVLGAYGLADYTTATSGYKFWVLSPGIEASNTVWEFRANGYFPLNKKRWIDEGWAGDFGDYQYIHFRGHQQWDQRFQYYQETGNGADAEVGRQLYSYKNILFKGYINGFYNNMQNNDDLYGAGARVTVEPTNYLKLSLAYSYDNYKHNALMIGAQVAIYSIFNPGKASQDLHQNLFKPIERNFATIDSGSSVRITRGDRPELAGEALRYDNIWFFDTAGVAGGSNAVGGDGTIEDPFTTFTLDSFNMINPNISAQAPRLYFAANNTFDLGTFSGYRFELPANWMMQGWVMAPGEMQNNHPAAGNSRPLFIGGFKLNSNTSINNLRLENAPDANGLLDTGIVLDNVVGVELNNVTIGTLMPNTSYQTGVYMESSSISIIDHSQIYGYTTVGDAIGLRLSDGGTITAINSSLMEGISVDNKGYGLQALSNLGPINIGNISDSDFIGTGTNSDGYGLNAESFFYTINIGNISNSHFAGAGRNGYGLKAQSFFGTFNISDISDSSFIGTRTGFTGSGFGFFANSDDSNTTIGSISDSNFTGTGFSGFGFFAESVDLCTTIDNISDSNFTGTGTNGDGNGFLVRGTLSTINIGNISNSNFTGTGFSGFGFFAEIGDSRTTIGDISNSYFTGTGINGDGYGLNAFGALGVTIDTITDSHFNATGAGKADGLRAWSDGGAVVMKNIINSSFFGQGTTDEGYGIYTTSTGTIVGDLINCSLSGSSKPARLD